MGVLVNHYMDKSIKYLLNITVALAPRLDAKINLFSNVHSPLSTNTIVPANSSPFSAGIQRFAGSAKIGTPVNYIQEN